MQLNETKISQDLLDAIEKIRLQLITRIGKTNLSQSEIINIAAQIDFFQELQSLGYGNLLEDYFKNYEKIILDIKKQADALGFNVGIKVRDLDAYINVQFDELLGRANQYGKELKTELLRNIIAGSPPEEIALSLSDVPLTTNEMRVAVNTGITQFERIGIAKIFEDEPNVKYRLVGPDDIRTRASCDAVLKYQPKDGWTKEEIDNGAATEIVIDHAKEFAMSSSEMEQALKRKYTFVRCGGWSCRHRFVVVSSGD